MSAIAVHDVVARTASAVRGVRRRGFAWVVACAWLALAGCSKSVQPLPNDAYVWQRVWADGVVSAMRESNGLVGTWHVLGAELDAHARWNDVTPDWHALASTHAPVVVVVRIDGTLDRLDDVASIAHIAAVLDTWKQRGVNVAGVEIDHDCATARLAGYQRFLAMLHTRLDPSIKLSITALPTWLDSPAALDGVLAQTDEAVLQVHAVMNPVQGLFDDTRALAWMRAFAQHSRHPWRVALPTYGTRVTWSRDGRVTGIESERPTLASGDLAHELVAQPGEISAFAARIAKERPDRLAGIVWFRLPTDDDTRAWSLQTWRAVLAHAPLQPALTVRADEAVGSAARDLVLVNDGNADAPLPARIRVDAGCAAADGINGYVIDRDSRSLFLRRAQDGLLRAGRQRTVGWIRCNQGAPALHVEP